MYLAILSAWAGIVVLAISIFVLSMDYAFGGGFPIQKGGSDSWEAAFYCVYLGPVLGAALIFVSFKLGFAKK